MRKLILTTASTFALTLSACGGGSSVFDSLAPATVAVMPSVLSHTASGTSVGGGTMGPGGADGAGIAAGDFGALEVRGFIRFDLSAIPAGAEILDADVRMHQADINATPYADLGELRVDHMDFGLVLNDADFAAAPLALNYGALSSTPVNEVKTLDVTDAVRADMIANRNHTDLRLRFQTPTDAVADADLAFFNDAEDTYGSGVVPQLVVTYRAP